MSNTAYRHIDLSQQIALQRQYLANMEAQLFSCDQDEAAGQAMLASDDAEMQDAGQKIQQNVDARRKQVALARKVGEAKLDELIKLSRLSERATERVRKPTKARLPATPGHVNELVPAKNGKAD